MRGRSLTRGCAVPSGPLCKQHVQKNTFHEIRLPQRNGASYPGDQNQPGLQFSETRRPRTPPPWSPPAQQTAFVDSQAAHRFKCTDVDAVRSTARPQGEDRPARRGGADLQGPLRGWRSPTAGHARQAQCVPEICGKTIRAESFAGRKRSQQTLKPGPNTHKAKWRSAYKNVLEIQRMQNVAYECMHFMTSTGIFKMNSTR